MATITLYANKINQISGLLKDTKGSVADYRMELSAVKKESLKINSSVCDLADVVSLVQASSKVQEDKITSLETIREASERFIEETVSIDLAVAELILREQNKFIAEYCYMQSCIDKGWEKICNALKSAGEWCKEHWVMVVTVAAVVAIALVAVCLGAAVVAIAAIAGIVSLVLTAADVICMVATGGKGIADVLKDNGLGWLGEIFAGITVGCDIVSILFPVGAAIKTMTKVGVKSFVKGSIQAAKYTFVESIEKAFKGGFKNGMKELGKTLFKTFVFDIDDFSRLNSNGKRVWDIMDHTPKLDIKESGHINDKGFKPDGGYYYPTIEDNYPDGFDGPISEETLNPDMIVDRYGDLDGKYMSPFGTPYKNRALAPSSKNAAYNMFIVDAPTDTHSGRIASWFREPGGGIQYKFDISVRKMLDSGNLRIVDFAQITLKSLMQFGERSFYRNVAGNVG